MPDAKDKSLAALKQVQSDMHQQFADNPMRLDQLDSALATAGMAIEHLHEEDAREKDLAQRVLTSRTARDKHGHQLRTALAEEA